MASLADRIGSLGKLLYLDIYEGELWSAPLRVDSELSNKAQWMGAHEKNEAALRSGVQDISSC